NDNRWAADIITDTTGNLGLPAITLDGTPNLGLSLSGDVIAGTNGGQREYRWGNHHDGATPPAPGHLAYTYASGNTKVLTAFGGFIDFAYGLINYMETYIDADGGPVWLYDSYLMPWFLGEYASGYYGVSGTVTSGATPLENATVQAFLAADPTTVVGATRTNPDGTYDLPLLQGTYNIIASKGGYVTSAPLSRVAANPYTAGVNFDLSTAGTVEGYATVFDPSMGYITLGGVQVTATGAITKTVTAGPDGYYIIEDLPAGAYTVSAKGEFYINAAYLYTYTNNPSASVTVIAGVTEEQNFELSTTSITGKVTDATTSAALHGAYVCVWETTQGTVPLDIYDYENRTVIRRAMAEEDGNYVLYGLAPGSYYVQAQATGQWSWTTWDNDASEWITVEQPHGYQNETWQGKHTTPYNAVTTTSGNEVTGIDFPMDSSTGRVYGLVRDLSNNPLAGASVKLELTAPEWMEYLRGTVVTVYTDSTGAYEAHVPAATYNVRASKPGYVASTVSQAVTIGGDHLRNFNLDVGTGMPGSVFIIHEVDYGGAAGVDPNATLFNQQVYDAVLAAGASDIGEMPLLFEEAGTTYIQFPQFADMEGWDMVIFNSYLNYVPDLDPALVGGNDYTWEEGPMAYMDAGGTFVYWHDWIDYISLHGAFQTTYMGLTGGYTANTGMNRVDTIMADPITTSLPAQKTIIQHADYSWSEVDSVSGAISMFNGYQGATNLNEVAGRTSDAVAWKAYGSSFFAWEYDTAMWQGDADYLQLIENLVVWGSAKSITPPILSDAAVTPASGAATTAFQYSVLWTDAEGDWPVGDTIEMVIDEGTAFEDVVYLASTGQGPVLNNKNAAAAFGHSQTANPPTASNTPATALTVANLNDQGANYISSTAPNTADHYATHRITFTATEDKATLDRLTVTYIGRITDSANDQHGGTLYIWNQVDGAYESLATTTSNQYVTLSGTINSNIPDYFNGNTATILVVSNRAAQRVAGTWRVATISSDYAQLGVRVGGDSTEGGMGFVYSLPANYFAGREGQHTYRFRNNGDGSFAALGQTGTLYGPTVTDGTNPVVTVDYRNSTVVDGTPIVAYANVTDNVAVGSVTLYYRVNAGAWSNKAMTKEGGIWPNLYRATIPQQAVGAVIDYYVTAVDTSSNTATDNNAGSYYQITITEGGVEP
ncbi:MAG: carboxypeptidase-like regulatory domain-containing protein, partial [Candidatus Thermoplasmatota archaeon]|nr:carboxypeptidase-like regulatory domain-containing protein [Candidatus Thermoplasmatota archaeon]